VRLPSLLLLGPLLAAACHQEPLPGPDPAATQALARARSLFADEKPFEAIAEVQRAVALAPEWAEAHLSLGKLLLTYSDVRFSTATIDRGRLEQAIEHLERACQLDPKNSEALYWSGAALAKADRATEARQRLERSLELRPDHGPTLREFGGVLAGEGDAKRAIEVLTRARQALPKDAEIALQLGLQLESEGRLEEARDAYLAACELNRAHPGPRAALITLYGRLGDPEKAEFMKSEFERCRAFGKRITAASQRFDENRRDPAACLGLAELYLEVENPAEARQWVERALRLDAKFAPAMALLERLESGGSRSGEPR
jgi:Flp pilus assembly protein TadD